MFTIDDVILQCIERGYASRKQKKQLREWCEKHPKDYYTEDDLIEIYRYFESYLIGEDVPFSKRRRTWDGHKTTKHYIKDVGNR